MKINFSLNNNFHSHFFSGITAQINQKVSEQKATADANFNAVLKQLTDSTANLLGQKDPAKVEQLQGSFNSVLAQTNALQAQLAEQGTAAQQAFNDILGKLYQNTLDSAKQVATQLDAGRQQ